MISILLYIFTSINLLIYLYIIVAVARKWRVSMAHRRFFFLALFSFLWILTRFLENIDTYLFVLLVHIDFSLAAVIAAMVASFALHFPRNNLNLSPKKELIFFLPIVILSVSSFTDLIVKPVTYRIIEYQRWYYIYIIILIIYFVLIGGGTLIKRFIRSFGIIRQQLIYILIGYLIAIIILLYDSISSYIFGPSPVVLDYLFLNSSILFSILIAYAMLKYRFMDIRVVFRKGSIYLVSLIIIIALYTYLALLFKVTIEKSWNINPGWTMFILVALVALGFPVLKSLVERSIEVVFKGRKSIDLAVKEVKEKMAAKNDFEVLIGLISKEIRKYLELEEVKFYLIDHKEQKFINQKTKEAIELSNPLVHYFEKTSNVLITNEIPYLIEKEKDQFRKEILKRLEKELKKQRTTLILPLKTEEEVFCLILLGKRLKAYTVQEVQFLEKLREAVTFTLANAILYQEALARVEAMKNEQFENNQY